MNSPDSSALASQFTSPDSIRADFSSAMSAMYRAEVPAYGTLIELVEDINKQVLADDASLADRLAASDDLNRISEERHGAIRLGTAAELSMIRRVFAVMGMVPVGYYDLSSAGIPVHSTAFRPVDAEALASNPFRVFTSLLRLELIADPNLRQTAERVLAARNIFSDQLISLVEQAELDGGLSGPDSRRFVEQVLEVFRWHGDALVSGELYQQLHDAHRLVADVVSFRGPHINHLTPRTLDIDTAQNAMADKGIAPKAVVEGPPNRSVPILLRQTSFKALEESVRFLGADIAGSHTARFGEIEQRGVALTRKGRALYDRLLDDVRSEITPKADGSNARDYMSVLQSVFVEFPDDLNEMRRQGLVYVRYRLGDISKMNASIDLSNVEALVDVGALSFAPQIYEDFLPVSAAGIFQSNLGDGAAGAFDGLSNRANFERDLGATVPDEFDLYAETEARSLRQALKRLKS